MLANHQFRNRHTVRNGLNLGGRTDGLVGSQTTLGIDQVRSENGVNQSRLSQTGLTCLPQKSTISQTLQFPFSPHPVPISTRGGITAYISRTNTHHVELETALQQLPLNLRSDAVETDMAARKDSSRRRA